MRFEGNFLLCYTSKKGFFFLITYENIAFSYPDFFPVILPFKSATKFLNQTSAKEAKYISAGKREWREALN